MIRLLLSGLLALPCFAQEWTKLPPIPDKLGVAAPFAGASGGALIVAGGANFPGRMPWEGGMKMWHDRVWLLDAPDGKWRDAVRHHADCFRLVWKNDALATQPLAPLPIALSGACGALVGDTLIVACGAEQPGEQAAANRAFALDLAAKTPAWRELPPLPAAPRLLAAAAAHEGTFYVFGGASLAAGADGTIARTWLREAWSYRAGPGWQRLADLPKPSVAAPSPAPFVEGKILLLAGDDGSRAGFQPVEKHPGFPKTIRAYDPALNLWSAAGEVPAPRATLPCVEWRGSFILPSGEVRPGVRSPEVWRLSK